MFPFINVRHADDQARDMAIRELQASGIAPLLLTDLANPQSIPTGAIQSEQGVLVTFRRRAEWWEVWTCMPALQFAQEEKRFQTLLRHYIDPNVIACVSQDALGRGPWVLLRALIDKPEDFGWFVRLFQETFGNVSPRRLDGFTLEFVSVLPTMPNEYSLTAVPFPYQGPPIKRRTIPWHTLASAIVYLVQRDRTKRQVSVATDDGEIVYRAERDSPDADWQVSINTFKGIARYGPFEALRFMILMMAAITLAFLFFRLFP